MCTLCQQLNLFEQRCMVALSQSAQPVVESIDADDTVSGNMTYSISVGQSFTGFLTSGDRDVVAIELAEGSRYTIDLQASSQYAQDVSDTFFILRDGAGTAIAFNDDITFDAATGNGNLYSSLEFTAPATATYYLEATTYRTATSDQTAAIDTGYYDLTVTGSAAELREYTLEEIANQLNYVAWNNASFSWDISPGDTLTVNLTKLTADGQSLARTALEAWEMVLGISFMEVSSGGQIDFDDNEAGAFAYFSHRAGTITSAEVNVSANWLTVHSDGGPLDDLSSYSFQTYVHEIGHALGLSHPGLYDGTAQYASHAEFLNDSWQLTIMSYFSQSDNTTVNASEAYVVTPQLADILALQQLYGAAGTLRSEDTTYGDNSTAGGYYDQLSSLRNVAFTIIDDGGLDTLDTSSFGGFQRVNMMDGAFSNVFGETGNLGIMPGTILENFEGGRGVDVVFGNAADNVIRGHNGDDSIYAGQGNDVLHGGGGNDRLIGNEGNDTMHGGAGDDIIKAREGAVNSARGGDGNDRIIGADSGDDDLRGENGSDIVVGLDGDDMLMGQNGDDFLYGGRGVDDVQGGEGNDVLRGNLHDDMLAGGAGQDRLFGGGQNDQLTGGADRDFLLGENGNDTLDGGSGDDNLTGGAGQDTFVYATPDSGYDRILDFESGIDKIDLSGAGVSSFTDLSAMAANTGFGLRLSFSNGNTILLENMTLEQITAADFVFA